MHIKTIYSSAKAYGRLNWGAIYGKKTVMLKGLSKRAFLACLVGAVFVCPVFADLGKRIDGIISQASKSKVEFSVKVIEAWSGREGYTHKSDTVRIPASNMKLVTSTAAVRYLGSGYSFRTEIGLSGKDLVVIGAGDPLLGDKKTDEAYGRKEGWIFEDIVSCLKGRGANSIRDVIVDSGFFDDIRAHPSWPKEQLNQPYACEVSGLNYNDNCVRITVRRAGKGVRITVKPETKFIKLINKVAVTSKGNSAIAAYRNSEANKITMSGKCRKEAGIDVAIERPGAFFGFLLAEKLERAGIKVQGKVVEKYVKKKKDVKIFKVYETPLADVLRRCNKNSLGLAAEALVKTISAENTKGRINGEWNHGLFLIERYLEELGINEKEFYLDDGSGLSRKNKLSANAIVKVLLTVYRSKDWEVFKDSLAVGGVDGTVSTYFGETKYKGRIIGKTGYIRGVRAFSGVCETEKGDYIFSILAEGGNSKVRKMINDIAKVIVDEAN